MFFFWRGGGGGGNPRQTVRVVAGNSQFFISNFVMKTSAGIHTSLAKWGECDVFHGRARSRGAFQIQNLLNRIYQKDFDKEQFC